MKRGFTLIELLIVVAIIAILAAIAVPNFLEAQTRAKVTRAQADMRSMATAIEAYAVDNNKYPAFEISPLADSSCPGGSAFLGNSVFFGDNQCAVSSRLIWITTPIAYLTSLFPEAFAVNNLATFATTGDQAEFYDTYDFLAAYNFTPGNTPGGNRGAGITSGAAWRLSSAGPDLTQAFGGSTVSAGTSPGSANELGADYDPTNGTVSTGDIVRIGGGPGPIVNDSNLPYYDRVGNRIGPP